MTTLLYVTLAALALLTAVADLTYTLHRRRRPRPRMITRVADPPSHVRRVR